MENENQISDEENLTQKLKNQDPEHFQHLVKMHLSFALDVNVNEFNDSTEKKERVSKWGFPFNRRDRFSKEPVKEYPDCVTLTDDAISQIIHIVDFLLLHHNICEEGIFRITGALSRQKRLKSCLKAGHPVDLSNEQYTVHDCASVLKTILADLPEPLVTDILRPIFCQISELRKSDEISDMKLLNSLQLTMLLLPNENYVILKRILHLLQLISENSCKNKMPAQNLATLFTPHLLCPRKLVGEALHMSAQALYSMLVFMIENASELFRVPPALVADVKLYWARKESKCRPENILDESVADSGVVNTVFSFVDREKTATENTSNPTETALAELYAHIQSLPESSKKRKLVKQFNRENGYGTPKKFLATGGRSRVKKQNIGDSLKKHIFGSRQLYPDTEKSLKLEGDEKITPITNNQETKIKLHAFKIIEKTLDCRECGCSDASGDSVVATQLISPHEPNEDKISTPEICPTETPLNNCRSKSTNLVARCQSLDSLGTPRFQLTSTPAPCFSNTSASFTVHNEVSPISMSAKKMPRAMQETIMTPRSRNPVIMSGSGTLQQLDQVKETSDDKMGTAEFKTCHSDDVSASNSSTADQGVLSKTFQDYLLSRSILTTSPADPSFSSRTSDFNQCSSLSNSEKLSDSLLFCLDGNVPVQSGSNSSHISNVETHKKCSQRVRETVL